MTENPKNIPLEIDEATGRPVAEVNYPDELSVDQDLISRFTDQGWEITGEGRDQIVLSKPNKQQVLKIVGQGSDVRLQTIKRYVEFFRSNQRNPHFPRVGFDKLLRWNDKIYYAYAQEALTHLSGDEAVQDYLENLGRSIAHNGDIPKNIPPGLTEEQVDGLAMAIEHLIERFGTESLDLGNVYNYMQRANGQIVIIDPLGAFGDEELAEGHVTEAFDKPYTIKWERGEHGDWDALTKLDDGTYLSIMFNKQPEDKWTVEFHRNNSQAVTGEGDSQRVFATVLMAIQQFIKKRKPKFLSFSASKDTEPGQKTQSRANLYDRLVLRYAKSWGYRSFRADRGDAVIYQFSKLATAKESFTDMELAIMEGGGSLEDYYTSLREEAAGVGVVANKRQVNDPRYVMSITKDVQPGEPARQAAKFGNKLDKNGLPPLLHKTAAKNTTPNKLMNLGLTESEGVDVKAWIKSIYDKYPQSPLNPRQRAMVWGEGEDQQFAIFELNPNPARKNTAEVTWFQAYPLRQGVGTRAMKELQAQARAAGIALTLYPWDKGTVSQSKLIKFYKQSGFKPTAKGAKTMQWESISFAQMTAQQIAAVAQDAFAQLYPGIKLYSRDTVEGVGLSTQKGGAGTASAFAGGGAERDEFYITLNAYAEGNDMIVVIEDATAGKYKGAATAIIQALFSAGERLYKTQSKELVIKDNSNAEVWDKIGDKVGARVVSEAGINIDTWTEYQLSETASAGSTSAGSVAAVSGPIGSIFARDPMMRRVGKRMSKYANSIYEFAPPSGGDDGDDGFSEETLKQLAAQWWNGDEDPRVESLLMAAGWEIGQDEGYDNGGVFVVQAGDINGRSYTSWPAEELEALAEGWRERFVAAGLGAAAVLGGQQIDRYFDTKMATKPTQQQLAQKPATPKEILEKTAKAAGLVGQEFIQFMAQCAHESLNFTRMVEIGSPQYFMKKYDKKFAPKTAKILGNKFAGDGELYKGRGFIQLTGRDNYARAGQALGLDLINNPDLAAEPNTAAKIAVWYWQNRVAPKVDNFHDTKKVTKKINPAGKGMKDRKEKVKQMQMSYDDQIPQPRTIPPRKV